MRFIWLLSVVFVLMLVASCGGDTIIEIPSGREYFPLRVGAEFEYQIDSIIFDDAPGGNTLDTFSGYVLERITAAEPIGGSDTLFTLERMFRRTSNAVWQLTDIWTMETTQRDALRTEENQTLVKLRFPLGESTKWDPTEFLNGNSEVLVGTEFIEMFSNWNGSVESVGTGIQLGDLSFDDVASVYQADDDNEIERRFVFEQYAAGVGLVFRTDTIVDSRCKRLGDLTPCFDNVGGELVSQPWLRKGEKGYILRQQLIRYN